MSLTWEEVQTQFENLVKFAAKNVYTTTINVDNSVSAEDLFQIGMLKLYDCWTRYNHLTMEEFKYVFNKTLFRAVRRGAKTSNAIDLELAVQNESVEPDYDEKLELSEGLEELKKSLESPIAIAILQELIEPSPRTLWEVWADKARKENLKRQGKNVNIPKNNDVKMKHIRLALGITQKQFDIGILEIRQKARIAFGVYGKEKMA